jgi:hypothetical protein
LLPGGWETLRFITMLLGLCGALRHPHLRHRERAPGEARRVGSLADNQHWVSLVRRPPPPPPKPKVGEKKEDAGAEEGKAAPEEAGKVARPMQSRRRPRLEEGKPGGGPEGPEANRPAPSGVACSAR